MLCDTSPYTCHSLAWRLCAQLVTACSGRFTVLQDQQNTTTHLYTQSTPHPPPPPFSSQQRKCKTIHLPSLPPIESPIVTQCFYSTHTPHTHFTLHTTHFALRTSHISHFTFHTTHTHTRPNRSTPY